MIVTLEGRLRPPYCYSLQHHCLLHQKKFYGIDPRATFLLAGPKFWAKFTTSRSHCLCSASVGRWPPSTRTWNRKTLTDLSWPGSGSSSSCSGDLELSRQGNIHSQSTTYLPTYLPLKRVVYFKLKCSLISTYDCSKYNEVMRTSSLPIKSK